MLENNGTCFHGSILFVYKISGTAFNSEQKNTDKFAILYNIARTWKEYILKLRSAKYQGNNAKTVIY